MVAEDGEPLLEDEVIKVFEGTVHGKQSGTFSHEGEFNLKELYDAFSGLLDVHSMNPISREDISVDFTWFCREDCPAIGIVMALGALRARRAHEDIYVFGDMGCITRDLVKEGPERVTDYPSSLGSAPGCAHGFSIASKGMDGMKSVGITGDSSFIHSGIQGLISAVYNRSNMTLIIFDNLGTGTSGFQPNPATGRTLDGLETRKIIIEELCRTLGAHTVVNESSDFDGIKRSVEDGISRGGVSVVVVRGKCPLLDETQDDPGL